MLGTREAARRLGRSADTIRRMCEAGYFPGANRPHGGHWRIPSHEVEDFRGSVRPARVGKHRKHGQTQ